MALNVFIFRIKAKVKKNLGVSHTKSLHKSWGILFGNLTRKAMQEMRKLLCGKQRISLTKVISFVKVNDIPDHQNKN